jgi:hypothetical protein
MKLFSKSDIPKPVVVLLKGIVARIPNTPYTYFDAETDRKRPSLGLLCMVANSDAPIYVDTDPKHSMHARYVMAGDFVDIRKTVTSDKNGETIVHALERNVSLIEDCKRQLAILREVLGVETPE